MMATKIIQKGKFLQDLGVRFSSGWRQSSTYPRCLYGVVCEDKFPARERTLLNAKFVSRPFSVGAAKYSQVRIDCVK